MTHRERDPDSLTSMVFSIFGRKLGEDLVHHVARDRLCCGAGAQRKIALNGVRGVELVLPWTLRT